MSDVARVFDKCQTKIDALIAAASGNQSVFVHWPPPVLEAAHSAGRPPKTIRAGHSAYKEPDTWRSETNERQAPEQSPSQEPRLSDSQAEPS